MPFIGRQMIDESMFMLDIFLSDVVADDRDHIIDNIECWHIGNDIDIMLLVLEYWYFYWWSCLAFFQLHEIHPTTPTFRFRTIATSTGLESDRPRSTKETTGCVLSWKVCKTYNTPCKLTWQWKITIYIYHRRYIFKGLVFDCHVIFPAYLRLCA